MPQPWPTPAVAMADSPQPIEPEAKPRYYSAQLPGQRLQVYVSNDTMRALGQKAKRLGLSRSGAAHHLLRLALELPPKRLPPQS
jgi:hypothetical protein